MDSLRRLTVLLLFLVAFPAQGGELRRVAAEMLFRLNAATVACQQTDPSHPDHGAFLCPGCGLYHTRAAEAVFPLAYEYSLTGNRERLAQAIAAADWLIRQQRDDGAWEETPETWTGTTTDQLLMLLLAYPIVRPHLDRKARKAWLAAMERAADYLEGFMDNRNASINYCSTTTATLAEAYLRFGKPAYRVKAAVLAHTVVAKMDADGFVEGEGGRIGDYRYGVDIGYNLEMSLWGLARYAEITGDTLVAEAVRRSAAAHITFIYPDGMLDGSAGTRSNKWTVYGSGTSDGCHPLWALLSDGDPACVTAAVRNIARLGDCFTTCGLLGQGPDYDAVRDVPPCIYPTFTKAKSLAMAHQWVKADTDGQAPLPLDRDTLIHWRTLDIVLVRRGPFCSTVTAYGYQTGPGTGAKTMFRPTGGAMSALWVEGFGLLQASSQTEYHRWEPMSFPEMGMPTPLTPRLEVSADGRMWTNLYEFDASLTASETATGVECRASGVLKDRERQASGVPYSIEYHFSGTGLTKTYELRSGAGIIVEPVIYDADLTVGQPDPHTILLIRPGGTLRLHSPEAEIRADWTGLRDCRQFYPSLRALPLVLDLPEGKPVTLIYKVLTR